MALWRAVWMIQARGNPGTPEAPPLVHRGGEGLLGGLLGHVEVADEPDQGGDDPAPVGAIDEVDGSVGVEGMRHEG